MARRAATRVTNREATRIQLPTVNENGIGTIVMKRYNNRVQCGEVTQYFDKEKLYSIVYDNGENKKISFEQLDQYRCTDTDRDTTRQITRLSTKLQGENLVKATTNIPSPTGIVLQINSLKTEAQEKLKYN